jgi:hypothetical protein
MVEGLKKKNRKRPEQKKNNPKPKKESPRVVPLLMKIRYGKYMKKLRSPPPHRRRRRRCGYPRKRRHLYPLP